MATTKDYIEYVCERLHGAGGLRYRKMFGEYMVYVNDTSDTQWQTQTV